MTRDVKGVLRLFMVVLLTVSFLLVVQTFAAQKKIDINKASVKELQSLEGIGETLSRRIVEYRTANGLFQRVKDVMKIKGIGKLTFEKIKGRITVGEESSVMPGE